MNKCVFLCLLCAQLLPIVLPAQQLKIGDFIPDQEISDIYNYAKDKIQLSGFQKELIILDFWDTRCGGCIKSFKRIDSLQKLFEQKIQIILINRSPKDFTNNFFNTHSRIYKPKIPFITNDKKFQEYFPHVGEPYYVIADGSGKILSMPETMHSGIINKLLANKNAQLLQKKKSIFLNSYIDEKAQPFVRTSSVLLKGFHSLEVSSPADSTLAHINFTYLPIATLFAVAYSDSKDDIQFSFTRPGRVIVETGDASSYFYPPSLEDYDAWLQNNAYSYHLIFPKSKSQSKYEFMKEDLLRGFDLKVKIEKRKLKCLTLVRTSTQDKIGTTGGEKKDNFFISSIKAANPDSIRSYSAGPYDAFSKRIQNIIEYRLKLPFVDATGFDPWKLMTIQMDGEKMDSVDINLYRAVLRKYHLDLVEKELVVKVLVLRNKKRK